MKFCYLVTQNSESIICQDNFENKIISDFIITTITADDLAPLALVPGHQQAQYRKISNIRCTQSQNLNDSCLIMQLPLPNPFKPGVKSRMNM